MKCYVYVAVSLDGYIAEKDGGIEWLNEIPNPEGSDFGFADFMKNIDAIVMGANTFRKVLSFAMWPYEKPVIVMSKSIEKIPENLEGKAEIFSGRITDLMKELEIKGYNNLYIDGGKTIQSFLREKFIDEMIITTIPVLLGDGIPLFGKLEQKQKFRHVKTEVLVPGLVKNRWEKITD